APASGARGERSGYPHRWGGSRFHTVIPLEQAQAIPVRVAQQRPAIALGTGLHRPLGSDAVPRQAKQLGREVAHPAPAQGRAGRSSWAARSRTSKVSRVVPGWGSPAFSARRVGPARNRAKRSASTLITRGRPSTSRYQATDAGQFRTVSSTRYSASIMTGSAG